MRCDVVIEVALSFVLDVEGEDVAREVFPCRLTRDELVAMLENVLDAVLKVADCVGISIPPFHIVLLHGSQGTVHCGEMVLLDVGIVAPAAELITIMKGDGKFDACDASQYLRRCH